MSNKPNGDASEPQTAPTIEEWQKRYAKAVNRHAQLVSELMQRSGDNPLAMRQAINALTCDIRAIFQVLVAKELITAQDLVEVQTRSLEWEIGRLDQQIGAVMKQQIVVN